MADSGGGPRRDRLLLVVVGTVAGDPYAGMAWMTMQIAAGLGRLGHDVYYMEVTSTWPYDPTRQKRVRSPRYAVSYLSRLANRFGLQGRWAYRSSYLNKRWYGLAGPKAERILASADAVFNIAGATQFGKEKLEVGRLVYYSTDPVLPELWYASGSPHARRLIDEHDDVVTYGENIGTPESRIPPLPRLHARSRQPILLEEWETEVMPRDVFTTVGNWKQPGLDIEFDNDTYTWSKHHEFLKFVDLPSVIGQTVELATNLGTREPLKVRSKEAVPSMGVETDVRDMLASRGWTLVDARTFTTDPDSYRAYLQTSRGEFTVGRDLNVRLRSGWFSERSACYLAAGRPVITQNTGFGTVLPTGNGLFAFDTMDEIADAFDAIRTDYARHSAAARDIAREYFRAESVMSKVLSDLGLS